MLVSGQILGKIGLKDASMGSVKDIILLMFNKYVFSGLVIYALATIYWFYIIKTNDLSKVYPMQSMSYIINITNIHNHNVYLYLLSFSQKVINSSLIIS